MKLTSARPQPLVILLGIDFFQMEVLTGWPAKEEWDFEHLGDSNHAFIKPTILTMKESGDVSGSIVLVSFLSSCTTVSC
jgi:hypothetical protein